MTQPTLEMHAWLGIRDRLAVKLDELLVNRPHPTTRDVAEALLSLGYIDVDAVSAPPDAQDAPPLRQPPPYDEPLQPPPPPPMPQTVRLPHKYA